MPDPYDLLEITFPIGWLRGGNRHVINLRKPPRTPARGWVIGRNTQFADIVLTQEAVFLGRRWLAVRLCNEGLFIQGLSGARSALTYNLDGDSDSRARATFCWMFFDDCPSLRLTVDVDDEDKVVRFRRVQNAATASLHRQAVAEYLVSFPSSVRDINSTEAAPPQALTADNLAMHTTQLPTGAQTSDGNEFFYLRQGALGHGQRGNVRLSRSYNDGRWVALKTLRQQELSVADNRDVLRRWNREIEINRILLEHPYSYICNCVEISPKDSEFAMDYCPVGTLRQIELRGAELSVLATQLFAALAHLAKIGLVHGDINFGNIYVFQRNPLHIKLGDFSEAFSSAHVGHLHQRLEQGYGARGYSAPEWDAEWQRVPVPRSPAWDLDSNDESADPDWIRAQSPDGTFESEEELVGKMKQPGPLSDVWAVGKLITLEIVPDGDSAIQLDYEEYEQLCEEQGETDPLCKLLSTTAVRVEPRERRPASQILDRLMREFPEPDIASETRENAATQTAGPTEFRTETLTGSLNLTARTITTVADNGIPDVRRPIANNPLDQLAQQRIAQEDAAFVRERMEQWNQGQSVRPRTARRSN